MRKLALSVKMAWHINSTSIIDQFKIKAKQRSKKSGPNWGRRKMKLGPTKEIRSEMYGCMDPIT